MAKEVTVIKGDDGGYIVRSVDHHGEAVALTVRPKFGQMTKVLKGFFEAKAKVIGDNIKVPF